MAHDWDALDRIQANNNIPAVQDNGRVPIEMGARKMLKRFTNEYIERMEIRDYM